jgi:hypothetical protein
MNAYVLHFLPVDIKRKINTIIANNAQLIITKHYYRKCLVKTSLINYFINADYFFTNNGYYCSDNFKNFPTILACVNKYITHNDDGKFWADTLFKTIHTLNFHPYHIDDTITYKIRAQLDIFKKQLGLTITEIVMLF